MNDHHAREPNRDDEQSPLLPSRGGRVARAILELSPPAQQASSLSTSSVWDVVDQVHGRACEQSAYNNEVRKLWGDFGAEYCSDQDLDDALFTSLEQAGTGKQTSLVDISALQLPTDALFHAALTSTWRNGRPRIDGALPPRVAHQLDLLTYVAGYALVISYVVNPPDRAVIYNSEAFGVREFFLVVFNIRYRFPSMLTLLAFFLGVGVPRDSTALSVATASRSRVDVANSMEAENSICAFRAIDHIHPATLQYYPSRRQPSSDAFAFLSIAFLSFLAIIVAFFLLAASPAPASTPVDEWQTQFYAVTAYYSIPYYFPPPLSVLTLLPQPYRKWVWRATVAPFAYALWGLINFVPWSIVARVAAAAPVLQMSTE
ncbi:hypothetical protein CPB85DRAFT_1427680 [Mucidula mucida]|nr:hypothetical protein CPB85DRAFT_1427680 [Mucidula mucida]